MKFFSMLSISEFKGESFSTPAILLGERGRGRKLVVVPCPKDLKEGEEVELRPTKSGKSFRIVRSSGSSQGWVAVLSGAGTYTRNTTGEVAIHPDQGNQVEVLKVGLGAYGAAGRVGSWKDYLAIVKPPYPVIFRIRPAGGSYKILRYWLVFWGDRVDKVTEEEEDFYADEHGLEFPEPKECEDLSSFL